MPAAPHTHTAGVTTEVSPDIATCPLEGKTPTDQGHVFKALSISASLSSGSFSVLPFVHPFLQTSFLYESKEASPGSLLSLEKPAAPLPHLLPSVPGEDSDGSCRGHVVFPEPKPVPLRPGTPAHTWPGEEMCQGGVGTSSLVPKKVAEGQFFRGKLKSKNRQRNTGP